MKTRRLRARVLCLLASVLLFGVGLGQAMPVRSVILMIGDGMGPMQVKLAELYNGQPLAMQLLPVEVVISTHSADNPVTDSAAAATALATGHKTDNGMIGVTPDGQPRQTILEAARARGKATGTITTTHPAHATPAAFVAHVSSRKEEAIIAIQVVEAGQDIIMGGGRKLFLPAGSAGSREDGRNLVQEAQALGYQYVEDAKGLMDAKGRRILGLFANGLMAYDIDRDPTQEPSLAEMTQEALQVLSRHPEGFFLLVEGGKIDTAGHDNDTLTNVRETLAFDAAIAVAVEYVRQHPETLLVVTADHETGGLQLEDHLDVEVLRGVKASTSAITKSVSADRSRVDEIIGEYTGIHDLVATETAIVKIVSNEKTIGSVVTKIVNTRAGVSWSTGSHTATHVPLYAFGAGSELFQGDVYDNTDVPKRLAEAMGITLN